VAQPAAGRDGTPESCLSAHAQDVEVKLDDIVPPLANISAAVAAEMAQQPLIPLDVSGERQFFLSWRHGRLEVRLIGPAMIL